MASWTHVTLNLDDDATFKIGIPDTDVCRLYVDADKMLVLLWLTPKAADGLIAAIQEAKERAWPAGPGGEEG